MQDALSVSSRASLRWSMVSRIMILAVYSEWYGETGNMNVSEVSIKLHSHFNKKKHSYLCFTEAREAYNFITPII